MYDKDLLVGLGEYLERRLEVVWDAAFDAGFDDGFEAGEMFHLEGAQLWTLSQSWISLCRCNGRASLGSGPVVFAGVCRGGALPSGVI